MKIPSENKLPMLDFMDGKFEQNRANSKPWVEAKREIPEKEVEWIDIQIHDESSPWASSIRDCFFRLEESPGKSGVLWVNFERIYVILDDYGAEQFNNPAIKSPPRRHTDLSYRFQKIEAQQAHIIEALSALYLEFTGRELPIDAAHIDAPLEVFVGTKLERAMGENVTSSECVDAYLKFCEHAAPHGNLPTRKIQAALWPLIEQVHRIAKSNSIIRGGKAQRGFNNLKLVDDV